MNDSGHTPETITLERDGERDLSLTGAVRIAAASSHHYEGPRNTRWTELALWRLPSGRLVLATVGRTQWVGETDRHAAIVCADDDALIGALTGEHGLGWLSKELLAEAGIEQAETVT